MNTLFRIAILIVPMLFLGHSASHAAQFVVIETNETTEELPLGKLLEQTDQISIADGSSVAFLSEDGRIIKVNGPFQGTLEQRAGASGVTSGGNAMSKIAKLIAPPENSVTLGASRSEKSNAPVLRTLPDPTLLSVMSNGSKCVIAANPDLWPADPAKDVTMSIRNSEGVSDKIMWPAGQDRLKLPAKFIVDRSELDVAMNDNQAKLTLHVRPGLVKNVSQILAWLIDRSCIPQARALLGVIRKEARAGQ